MFIKSMSMKNFRCHKDTTVDFFKTSEKGNISIIEGSDGDGKTTIFNAIGWCLYGRETSELLEEPKQSLGILNVSSLNSEGLTTISVEIWLEFEESSKSVDIPTSARVLRKAKVREMAIVEEEFLLELYTQSGNPKVLYDREAKNYIENIAPSDLIEFYMFNGEYLKNSKNTRGDNVNNSIKRQFKIGAIMSMENLLSKLETDYREKANKAANIKNNNIINNISSLDESIHKNESKKEGLTDTLENYSEKARVAQDEMNRLRDDKLKIESKKEILKKLSDKKEKKKKIMEEYRKSEKAMLKAQVDYGFLLLSKDTMVEAYSKIKGELGKGNLPPNIKKEFVADLISMHECICGRVLSEDSKEIEIIKNLLKESEKESDKSIMLEIAPQLNATIQILETRVPEMLKGLTESMKQKLIEIREVDQEIEDSNNMDASLSKEEEEVISKYYIMEKDYINFTSLVEGTKKEIKKLESQIGSDKDKLSELKEKQEKMVSKASEAEHFQKWAKTAKIYERILSELRDKITSMFISSMQEEVNKLISSIRGLSHLSVRINNVGNSVKVEYRDSYLSLDDAVYISEGQNQIISIALIAAYTSILRNFGNGITEAPFIVMDHPFSDLSLPRKEELLKSFRTLFDRTKVIILTPAGDFNFDPISETIASHFSVKNDPEQKICRLVVK